MKQKGHPQAKVINTLKVALVVIIGVGATAVIIACAVVAAFASRDVAVATGIVRDPALAWLIPVIIEGGCAASLGLASIRTMTGQDTWRELLAAFVLLLLAAAVNMFHADYGPEWLGSVLPPILAASPPLIMAATVEMVLRSLRVETRKTRKAAPKPVIPATAKVTPQRSQVAAPKAATPPTVTEPVTATAKQAAAAEYVRKVEELFKENPNITGDQVSERIGGSAQHARRTMKPWKDQLKEQLAVDVE